ncbi:MAG: hypothetical protein HGN29_04210 [Asgard group archaeon]|nr:hypothetical protein [Asgard group archaeon]
MEKFHRFPAEIELDNYIDDSCNDNEIPAVQYILFRSGINFKELKNFNIPPFKKINWKKLSVIEIVYHNKWLDCYLFYGYKSDLIKEIFHKLDEKWQQKLDV